MLTLGSARLDLRLSVRVDEHFVEVPIQWDAAHDQWSADGVHVETGRVPDEPVWIARLEVDAAEFVVTVETGNALSVTLDHRLGVVELSVEEGVIVVAITPDGGLGRQAAVGLTLNFADGNSAHQNPVIRRAIANDAATVAIAYGADGLHARAALFPFLAGARSRAGLAAAKFAQSSGASSRT